MKSFHRRHCPAAVPDDDGVCVDLELVAYEGEPDALLGLVRVGHVPQNALDPLLFQRRVQPVVPWYVFWRGGAQEAQDDEVKPCRRPLGLSYPSLVGVRFPIDMHRMDFSRPRDLDAGPRRPHLHSASDIHTVYQSRGSPDPRCNDTME